MHRFILVSIASASLALAAPPERDRQAILSMAGTHSVTFKFQETAAIAPGYQKQSDAYEANATEVVVVAKDSPECITLQHLLIVTGKDKAPHVIKHWAQTWTWQDTELLDYCGSEDDYTWNRINLIKEQALGTWSQLVTQTDDTPRYEGYGCWTHHNSESSWQSNLVRRPLPRREYSKRDDYDYLIVTNRHTLTPDGWIHYQDNRKVVDRKGETTRVLCHEAGLNIYVRTESSDANVAIEWWEEHSKTWNRIREFWRVAGESAQNSFTYSTFANGEGLSRILKRLEKEGPEEDAISSALQPYIISK